MRPSRLSSISLRKTLSHVSSDPYVGGDGGGHHLLSARSAPGVASKLFTRVPCLQHTYWCCAHFTVKEIEAQKDWCVAWQEVTEAGLEPSSADSRAEALGLRLSCPTKVVAGKSVQCDSMRCPLNDLL